MDCINQISHSIRRGENLYQLAIHYHTTVPSILALNPGIDPYHLQLGAKVEVCPGDEYFASQRFVQAVPCEECEKCINLMNQMRQIWGQHEYWTRLAIISITEKLKDQNATINRLLQNPGDVADVYSKFYSTDVTQKIAQLLTEHLQIGAELITALRDGKTAEADVLNQKWYKNADQLAEMYGSFNPYYSKEMVRDMFYRHLKLTSQVVAMRLAQNFQADVEVFRKAEDEMMEMADYFASGIVKQFPNQFR